MSILKKTLVFSLVLGIILEQIYVFRYYFKGTSTSEVECSELSQESTDGATIIQSILKRFKLEKASSTTIPPTPKELEEITPEFLGPYKIFFMIMSDPDSQQMRKTLRETWINQLNKNPNLGYKFIIGTGSLTGSKLVHLEIEERENKDVILLKDLVDNQLNITLKVLKSYVWAYKNVESEYLLKLQDDSYVIPQNLLKQFQDYSIPKIQVILGKFMWKLGVQLDEGERWGEPDWFLCPDSYLPFPRGEGYLVSWDIVEFIHTFADDFRMYRHDDITMGVWVCGLELKRIDSNGIVTDNSGCDKEAFIFAGLQLSQISEKHHLWNDHMDIC
ncbi:Beta-1,3-galactosyltransferase 6 [Oopsacas minuta]|uniref:Hexosyltransferase n=1 Tax=Oopsacas minuta TaxID=111878 RepID=A0AAV7JHM0_9METZ|nr:Beta-1,3-galactosyltransferase 6 [Oopsacas minuta]